MRANLVAGVIAGIVAIVLAVAIVGYIGLLARHDPVRNGASVAGSEHRQP